MRYNEILYFYHLQNTNKKHKKKHDLNTNN